MKKKILLCLLSFLMIFFSFACGKKPDESSQVEEGSVQQLQIFKSDLKLTQEQVMSQIKAEHIKTHKGYLDSDEIVIMITLEDDALIDVYNKRYSSTIDSVASFVNSPKGQNKVNQLTLKQDALIEELQQKGLIDSVENRFTTILNAIAVKTTYGRLDDIEALDIVKSTILSDTYNLPW